jgi:U3 small nucleolar RNA-associated protein 4
MLAVADIAGYIDTWILSDESPATNGDGSASDDDASSGDESSDDDAVEDGGQQWRRNPAAKLLPKLPSSPVVLSFSGDCPQSSRGTGSSTSADDYTLLAITSSWYILTFHPLQGQLTDWSRRNPRKTLPGSIRDLLDLAQGVFWEGPRMWVYGISFLFMIDTSQDMPPAGQTYDTQENGAKGLKRKRTGPTTGAGGKMVKGNTVPHQVLRHSGKKAEDLDMEEEAEDSDANSDEEMEEANGELSDLRNDLKTSQAVVSTDGQKRWWITHKYRPVLGMVSLSDPGQPLEIALIERPTWDVEMAEKYYAGNEYRR